MDEAKAKSNLCTIFYFPKNDGKKSVLGCGCVIKGSDQNLKIATSRKISSSNDVEIFAKFESQDQIIKLQFATGGEGFENGDDEIAYVSFDDTEFKGQLSPDGLVKADLEGVDAIACFVPVLENLEQFREKGEFSFYEVVKNAEKCSLQKEVGSNKRSIDNKREMQKYHLEVLGSPILSKDCKFLGIVDFLEVEGNESLLRINYHDGIQRNFVKGGSSTTQQKTVVAQETNYGINRLSPDGLPTPAAGGSQDSQQETTDGGRNIFSIDDHLRLIWNDAGFRDRFTSVLDVKYTRVKYWPHLAEQFDIKWAIYDAFSTSDINSPTERLLEHLEGTDPDYTVQDFVQDCKTADAYEVSRIVEDSVKAGILDNEDLVSEICDKAPRVLDEVVLKLDRESRLWNKLAVVKNVLKKEYSTFESDRTTNPARLFFDVLRTQGPEITIGDFKEKSKKTEKISSILKKSGIEDKLLLKDLSKESPGAKSEIESFLNNLKTEVLWNLATQYQQEGLMEDIDVETAFRQEEDCHSPTEKVMDYVLASSPKKYTIKDLIVKLWNINRKDCFDVLQPYLKGGKNDIDKITKGLKRLQPEERLKKQPCTGDESVSSTPVSDNSEESQNQYVMAISAKK